MCCNSEIAATILGQIAKLLNFNRNMQFAGAFDLEQRGPFVFVTDIFLCTSQRDGKIRVSHLCGRRLPRPRQARLLH